MPDKIIPFIEDDSDSDDEEEVLEELAEEDGYSDIDDDDCAEWNDLVKSFAAKDIDINLLFDPNWK